MFFWLEDMDEWTSTPFKNIDDFSEFVEGLNEDALDDADFALEQALLVSRA